MIVTLIRCRLAIAGRWAVGSAALGDAEIDLPVALDPRPLPASPSSPIGAVGSTSADGGHGHPSARRPYLPGTALAGSLREHLAAAGLDEAWMGSPIGEREETTGTRELSAGPLRILGTRLGSDAGISHRGQTAVDGLHRAAQQRARWDSESSTGTTVDLLMEVEARRLARDDTDPLNVADLIDRLATWQPVVGRGRSVGMGRAALSALDAVRVDTSDPEHLAWWLSGRHSWLRGETEAPQSTIMDTPELTTPAPAGWTRTTRLRVRDPIHVGSGAMVAPREAIPVLRSGDTAYIPGSSWKGLFRHRCDVILHAVGAPDPQRMLDVLFGSIAQGRGLLAFDDSDLGAETITRTHVAIDRFSGGARDGALYTVESVPAGAHLSLVVRCQVDSHAVENLLRHVIRDLHDGLVGVGGGTSRGYGWVEVVEDDDGRSTPHRPQTTPVDLAALLEDLPEALADSDDDGVTA